MEVRKGKEEQKGDFGVGLSGDIYSFGGFGFRLENLLR